MQKSDAHSRTFGRQRDYVEYFTAEDSHYKHLEVEAGLAGAWQAETEVAFEAFCAACNEISPLLVDRVASAVDTLGGWHPNWRERLICPRCGLNTRQRVMIDDLQQALSGSSAKEQAMCRLYATEQISPFYDWLWANTGMECVGSEYLGAGSEPGSYTLMGGRDVRHEDVEALSFEDEYLDYVFSNDVLEHVDQPRKAITEIARVLRPGGEFFLSVPFSANESHSRRRAKMTQDGIEHLVEPEYHHDPLSAEGVLVFYNYGWDLLEWLREAGLKNVRMRLAWSESRGYLGTPLYYFHAVKPSQKWWQRLRRG